MVTTTTLPNAVNVMMEPPGWARQVEVQACRVFGVVATRSPGAESARTTRPEAVRTGVMAVAVAPFIGPSPNTGSIDTVSRLCGLQDRGSRHRIRVSVVGMARGAGRSIRVATVRRSAELSLAATSPRPGHQVRLTPRIRERAPALVR